MNPKVYLMGNCQRCALRRAVGLVKSTYKDNTSSEKIMVCRECSNNQNIQTEIK